MTENILPVFLCCLCVVTCFRRTSGHAQGRVQKSRDFYRFTCNVLMKTGTGVMFPCPVCFRLIGGSDYKLIYRHYATLYFVFCVDSSESELGILDLIQVKSWETVVYL